MNQRPALHLDHIVYAVPDLNAACERFAQTTGCEPLIGGSHLSLGTCNALVSFGEGIYLEIIAPDPTQTANQDFAKRLAELDAGELFHYAVRCDDLPGLASNLRADGLDPTPPLESKRQSPDGALLVWDLMLLPGRGGAWPFFIDWRECPHPSRSAPIVGPLASFDVTLPRVGTETGTIRRISGVRFDEGPPNLRLAFDSPHGRIEWHKTDPTGFASSG